MGADQHAVVGQELSQSDDFLTAIDPVVPITLSAKPPATTRSAVPPRRSRFTVRWANPSASSRTLPAAASYSHPSTPLDLREQQRLISAHRKERVQQWVERNAPPLMSPADRKHAMHMAILEADRYHVACGSDTLVRKLEGIIEERHGSTGIPAALKLSPGSTHLPAAVVKQLFFDLDWIVDNYRNGPAVAQRALEEMNVWR